MCNSGSPMQSTAGGVSVGRVVKVGQTVFGAASHVGIVAVLTVHFVAGMLRIRATFYRFLPHSRRPRAILIGDEVVAKVGDWLFGNVLTSVIAGRPRLCGASSSMSHMRCCSVCS